MVLHSHEGSFVQIGKFYKKLAVVGLLLLGAGCQVMDAEIIKDYFQSGFVAFTPSEKYRRVSDLNRFTPGTAVVLLPVRSIMGGGLAEERVTKYFNRSMKKYFGKLRVITDEEADRIFDEQDLWDDYLEYLTGYQQSPIIDFEQLRYLYSRLKAKYIISVSADYFVSAMYFPNTLVLQVYVEVWDLNTGEKIWEGKAEGENVIGEEPWMDEVISGTVDLVCQRMVQEMRRDLSTITE